MIDDWLLFAITMMIVGGYFFWEAVR